MMKMDKFCFRCWYYTITMSMSNIQKTGRTNDYLTYRNNGIKHTDKKSFILEYSTVIVNA